MKAGQKMTASPNMPDYAECCETFSWGAARRELEFLTSLRGPAAIMRRLLKARELGLPERDISTLEPS